MAPRACLAACLVSQVAAAPAGVSRAGTCLDLHRDRLVGMPKDSHDHARVHRAAHGAATGVRPEPLKPCLPTHPNGGAFSSLPPSNPADAAAIP